MDSLPLVHAAETHVLFLRCDSGGQVGGPPPRESLPSSSLAQVFDIPIMVSIVEDLCYFLTQDFQTGIHFPNFGFCAPDGFHSRWYTKGLTRRNGTVTQA